MRSYREIVNFLLIREQLSLGWKIGFFIVCGALVFGSATLMRINVQSVDLAGTVVSHGADPTDEGHVAYLIVRLDNGATRPSELDPSARSIFDRANGESLGKLPPTFSG
jgi:hypothetical protein